MVFTELPAHLTSLQFAKAIRYDIGRFRARLGTPRYERTSFTSERVAASLTITGATLSQVKAAMLAQLNGGEGFMTSRELGVVFNIDPGASSRLEWPHIKLADSSDRRFLVSGILEWLVPLAQNVGIDPYDLYRLLKSKRRMLLSNEQVAERLGYSIETVARQARNGQLNAQKLPKGQWRVLLWDV